MYAFEKSHHKRLFFYALSWQEVKNLYALDNVENKNNGNDQSK